jgi:hypothetical protein
VTQKASHPLYVFITTVRFVASPFVFLLFLSDGLIGLHDGQVVVPVFQDGLIFYPFDRRLHQESHQDLHQGPMFWDLEFEIPVQGKNIHGFVGENT